MVYSYDAEAVKGRGGLMIPRIPEPSSPTDTGGIRTPGLADPIPVDGGPGGKAVCVLAPTAPSEAPTGDSGA